MKLAVVILNWNAAEDTIGCMRELAGWGTLQPEVWIVDNASEDGSAGQIEAAFPNTRLIVNAENLGYAAGNNRALREILQHHVDYVLLLNNDATVSEADTIQMMALLEREPAIGIVGPPLFDAQQPARLLTAGGQNPIRHLTSHVKQLAAGSSIQLVDYIPGTVMLVKAEVLQAAGLLDEAYFFSGEIPDFCERAKGHGYRSAVLASTRGYHTVSRSSQFRDTLYTYYIIRNRFLFIRKFQRQPSRFGFTIVWLLYSVTLSGKLYLTGKQRTATAVWLGLVDGLAGRFGGQNERVLAACGLSAKK